MLGQQRRIFQKERGGGPLRACGCTTRAFPKTPGYWIINPCCKAIPMQGKWRLMQVSQWETCEVTRALAPLVSSLVYLFELVLISFLHFVPATHTGTSASADGRTSRSLAGTAVPWVFVFPPAPPGFLGQLCLGFKVHLFLNEKTRVCPRDRACQPLASFFFIHLWWGSMCDRWIGFVFGACGLTFLKFFFYFLVAGHVLARAFRSRKK